MEDNAYTKNLKVLSLFLVLILGYYVFLYNPMLAKIKSYEAKQKYSQERLAHMQQAFKKINSSQAQAIAITQEEIDQALKEIFAAAKSRDINVGYVSVKDTQKYNSLYTIIPVLIEVESTYEKLGIFLGALENKQGNLVTVKTINLKLHQKNDPILKASVFLNIYIVNKYAQ